MIDGRQLWSVDEVDGAGEVGVGGGGEPERVGGGKDAGGSANGGGEAGGKRANGAGEEKADGGDGGENGGGIGEEGATTWARTGPGADGNAGEAEIARVRTANCGPTE